jgi:hypothetical protein
MRGTGFPVDRLGGRDRFHGPHDIAGRKQPALADAGRKAHCLGEAFNSAKSASRRSGKTPSALTKADGSRLAKPHSQLDPDVFLDDLQALDFVSRGHNTFGEAEAERESSRSFGVAIMTA